MVSSLKITKSNDDAKDKSTNVKRVRVRFPKGLMSKSVISVPTETPLLFFASFKYQKEE